MVTKVHTSRQLNFLSQNLPETVESIEDDDSELMVTTLNNNLDDKNGDLKMLEISNDEPLSASFGNKGQSHCKGDVMNGLNTLYGGNIQSDVGSKRSKMHKDKKPFEFSKSITAVDVDNRLESTESDGTELMFVKRKSSSERDKVSNVDTENFEMLSDEDLFGDPLAFASLCGSSDALCHETQASETNDNSQQSFELMDNKQCHYLSQPVASVKQGNHSNTHEIKFPPSSVETKSQLGNKKELLSVQPSSTQRQKSLLPFVSKSNMKTGSTKQSLKQTDIGVFFGLKPLAKPGDSKLAGSQNDTKASSSSQPSSVSSRYGRWKGRKMQNQSDANKAGYMSEGQSSVPGEEAPVAPQSRKSCPFYKKIPGSTITVDAFRYGDIPGCRAYLLSHFHYDHYGGLNGKFTNPVYCSKVSSPANHY